MEYSLSKGLNKGFTSALTIAMALVVFTGFSDITLWELLETYLKPALGGMTAGGLLTMLANYMKVSSK